MARLPRLSARGFQGFVGFEGRGRLKPDGLKIKPETKGEMGSLPDAEFGEDDSEEVFGVDLAGDFTEGV